MDEIKDQEIVEVKDEKKEQAEALKDTAISIINNANIVGSYADIERFVKKEMCVVVIQAKNDNGMIIERSFKLDSKDILPHIDKAYKTAYSELKSLSETL